MSLLLGLGNKAYLYALIGLFIVGVIYRIYKAGGDAKELEILEKEVNNVIKRNSIEDDVDRMSDSAVFEQLRKRGWFRDAD